jgi:tetratricopeptide (TPR) repeat protein
VEWREKMELAQIKQEEDLVKVGNTHDSQGRYEEAIESYDKALQIDPDDADAWFDKGETLKKMGKLTEAEKCFEKSTNLYCGD